MCGYDLNDPNPETRTVQNSLNACILDCHNALGKACPGVTWLQSGQDQQYCYYKPATATFVNVNNAAIQSARRVCYPTVPACPAGNQTLYQSKNAPYDRFVSSSCIQTLTDSPPGTDGSIFRLDCNIDYPVSDSGSLYTTSIQACMDTCDQRGSTCAASVYVPSYGSSANPYSCILKSAAPARAATKQTYECDTVVRLNTGSSLATGTEVACTANNGATYRTADGSQWQIVCSTDVSNFALHTPGCLIVRLQRNNMLTWDQFGSGNLVAFNVYSLRVCIDRCAAYGAGCAGAAWTPNGNGISSQPTCYLKSAMTNRQSTTYVTHAFKRIAAASFSTGPSC